MPIAATRSTAMPSELRVSFRSARTTNPANDLANMLTVIARAVPTTTSSGWVAEIVKATDGFGITVTLGEEERYQANQLFNALIGREMADIAYRSLTVLSQKIIADEYGPPKFPTRRDGAIQRKKDGIELARAVVAFDAGLRAGRPFPKSWMKHEHLYLSVCGPSIFQYCRKLLDLVKNLRGSFYESEVNKISAMMKNVGEPTQHAVLEAGRALRRAG